jgi:hypothetical protein
VFVARVEAQLVDYNDFTARAVANAGYEKIVNTMLDTLQHMAKMDRSDVAGEDKGQLNHSIIMIGGYRTTDVHDRISDSPVDFLTYRKSALLCARRCQAGYSRTSWVYGAGQNDVRREHDSLYQGSPQEVFRAAMGKSS